MKNNYDTSTKWVNLEISVFYDWDVARMDFENDFESIKKNDDKFFYISWGMYSMDWMHKVDDRDAFIKEFNSDYHELDENELKDLDFILVQYDLDDSYAGVIEKYPSFAIRWYSQWDYAKIYYNPDCLTDTFTEKSLKEYCEHTFYDAPLYCRLEIDWEEFCFEEYMKDSYDYDTDEIIQIAKDKIVHDKKDYIVQWLSENLPEHPEYN